ncbi:MAG: alpha/beta hydrolase [Clostridia bacterium]|nr:alpha/beta hydrolase [Clostridia bacterium]
MIFKRIEFNEENNVYMNAYLHENCEEWNYAHTRPAVVVCPGGGYGMCAPREADPIARRFLAAGYNAFVLYYSLGERAAFPQPLVDLSKAMKYIREHAKEWNILKDKIAVCGFSAGGHLTASLGTLWNNSEVQTLANCSGEENKPNALILGYPVISTRAWMVKALPRLIGDRDEKATERLLNTYQNVGPHTPPTFMVHTFMDHAVAVDESMVFANALNNNNIPFELHIFPNGRHGLGLGDVETCGEYDPSFSKWMELCLLWLGRVFEDGEKLDPSNRARPVKEY